MKNFLLLTIYVLAICIASACGQKASEPEQNEPNQHHTVIQPLFVSDTVAHDTDDPAIWVHPENPALSLIIGTDKDEDGALYVFNLEGKIIPEKTIKGLKRPNNVDIAYGLILNGKPTDIAVVTERMTHQLRIFSLPDMQPLDGGGIPVFEHEQGEEYRDLMGIALYKRPADGVHFAIVGRKNGPSEEYLWQYQLSDNGQGQVQAKLVRRFGQYSGRKEIEAIAVDQQLGYVYCADETYGIRKYYADPEKGNEQLALFGTTEFARDHEGISIYQLSNTTGYILVSDQQANQFHVYTREGSPGNPHEHQLVHSVKVAAIESDGSEVVSTPLNSNFSKGLFVAMSNGKVFHLYRWEDIAGEKLQHATKPVPVR